MHPRAIIFTAALLLSASLIACEETVSPILESDRQFTLYGTLDMAEDTQFVRVIPIRPTLVAEEERLGATVTSINLTDGGEPRVWRDSIVVFDDGSFGYLFYYPMRVSAGHTYRIEAQPNGSDIITSAETTVPAAPTPEVGEERVIRTFTTRVQVLQVIRWEGVVSEPYSVEHWYRFFRVSNFSFEDYRLPYTAVNGSVDGEPGVWEVDLNLVRDRDTLATELDLEGSAFLAGLGMTLTILDEQFVPPGGSFDPEVLAQPGTFSNVNNGFGFIGSVGRFSVEWLIADTVARTLRYNPLDPSTLGKNVEVSGGAK